MLCPVTGYDCCKDCPLYEKCKYDDDYEDYDLWEDYSCDLNPENPIDSFLA